ncbi:MAG: SagB/ThcOx family dehydrogenase [Defluviitaleaceae bacterium]|nr:SagB/ThcOx family dehydrogenase [Defluviitaleaceae bacterium]
MDQITKNRKFMQCPDFSGAMMESDQSRGVHHPPHGNNPTGNIVALPSFDNVEKTPEYSELLDIRRSHRVFTEAPVSQAQLAYMLWTAQGVQDYRGANNVATLRPAPSGGARHPFELYAVVQNVEGLLQGVYRYLPLENVGKKTVHIEYLSKIEDYATTITDSLAGQKWASSAPVVLYLTCVPYRAEWRYATASHRVMLIDLGHVGQNIMLSAAALGFGSCCIAAYKQKESDKLLGVNGIDEYTVYAVPFGGIEK